MLRHHEQAAGHDRVGIDFRVLKYKPQFRALRITTVRLFLSHFDAKLMLVFALNIKHQEKSRCNHSYCAKQPNGKLKDHMRCHDTKNKRKQTQRLEIE